MKHRRRHRRKGIGALSQRTVLFFLLIVFVALSLFVLFGPNYYFGQLAQALLGRNDSEAPLVSLKKPGGGDDLFAGETVKVMAEANDNVRVAQVEFSVDGKVLTKDTRPPFEADWYPEFSGTYQLVVTARDMAGNRSSADFVLVDVAPEQGSQEASASSFFGGK